MEHLKLYNAASIKDLYSSREGEEKIGDTIAFVEDMNCLAKCDATFVLLGIPEEIGVKANFGVGGASSLWKSFLGAFLGVQSNYWLQGRQIALLGEVVVPSPQAASVEQLRAQVKELDNRVAPIVQKIIEAGKTPIVIGGGHNNAYPILMGLSKALKQAINTINIDAHADIRTIQEGRHSGNGFSQAMNEGYLAHYGIFGLHQSYNNHHTLRQIADNNKIKAVFFEDLLLSDAGILAEWKKFRAEIPSLCGLEIDLDAITNMLSSATSATGFELNDVRKILLSDENIYAYLHICEGAAKLDDGREQKTLPKSVAYLVCDFLKRQLNVIHQKNKPFEA